MAYTDFQFPGVELTQEFVETELPVSGISTLGVALIGQKYMVSNATTTNPTIVISGYTGSAKSVPSSAVPEEFATELEGSNPEFILDQSYEHQSLLAVDGEFEHLAITGGKLVLDTIDIDGTTVSKDHKAVIADINEDAVGMFVDVVSGGSTYTGEIAEVKGETASISFDTAIAGGTVTAKSVYFIDTAIVGVSGNTTAYMTLDSSNEVEINLPASLRRRLDKGTDGNWTYDKKLQKATKFQIYYRAAERTTKLSLGSITSVADIVKNLGQICADNPLALNALFAFNAAGGDIVYYVKTASTTSDIVARYSEAVDFLAKNPEIYSIVPDIEADAEDGGTSKAIIGQLLTQVVDDSSDKESKVRRALWFGVKNPSVTDRSELTDKIIANMLGIHSYRAQAVWADDALYNGEVIPNSALAAAAAGMRAGQPVHRPISNLGYSQFSINERYGFTKKQLETLGANGIWIIGPNFYGTPINMRQVTTDNSGSLMRSEESIISNADSIALALCHLGERMVGNSNISPALITALTDAINTVMVARTKNMTGNDLIGPQLLSWSLDRIYQDETFRDHIYATITCEPPRPFNRFVMTLRIV